MKRLSATSEGKHSSRTLVYATGILLFLVWSNGFVAQSFLLGGEKSPARFDALGMAAARFTLVSPLCLFYAFGLRRRQSLEILRRFPRRLAAAALLSVPFYNWALFTGLQFGVPAPVASLTTALTPLFLMIFATAFLGEALSARKATAFLVSFSGMLVIAASRSPWSQRLLGADGAGGGETAGNGTSYALLLAITALAPLCWSLYTILSKPAITGVHPLDWTYLVLGLGGLPLFALLPWHGGQALLHLDGGGWFALLYQTLLGTIGGYAVWSWLLQRLPASSIGFFTFLNPPLTALSKYSLARLFPAVFVWRTNRFEILGAVLALCGLALALSRARGARGESAASGN